jgi:hypothetical protein
MLFSFIRVAHMILVDCSATAPPPFARRRDAPLTYFRRCQDVELNQGVGVVLLDHQEILDQVLLSTGEFVDGLKKNGENRNPFVGKDNL